MRLWTELWVLMRRLAPCADTDLSSVGCVRARVCSSSNCLIEQAKQWIVISLSVDSSQSFLLMLFELPSISGNSPN